MTTEPTLDPQEQAVMDDAAAAGLPDITRIPVAESRARLREQFVTDEPAEAVLEVQDIDLPAPRGPVRIRPQRLIGGAYPQT